MSLSIYLFLKLDTGSEDEWYPAFSSNITHNLGEMASQIIIGDFTLYHYLWRPQDINVSRASQLITPLHNGILELKINKEKYEAFNAPNGWGTHVNFVPFIQDYLDACIKYPEAEIEVSR